MHNTKVMVAFTSTYLLFWFFTAGLAWVLTGDLYRGLLSNAGVLITTISAGWVPAFIVAIDIDESMKIRKKTTEIENNIIKFNQGANKFRSYR